MISAWHLLWIVPLAGVIGAALTACVVAGDDPCEDCPYDRYEEEDGL